MVKIRENEYFPADLILLNSSYPKGMCYVETKNLDGETNLKYKQAPAGCPALCKDDDAIFDNFTSGEIECEKENAKIYSFRGNLRSKGNSWPIDIDNVLLRGSSLRNTKWIYGVTVYTGHDTKVMMNSVGNASKLSSVEKASNYYIIMSIGI